MVFRFLLWFVGVLLTLAIATGGWLFWAGKRAEPSYAGTIALEGLAAPVRVRYGAHAVPSLEASSIEDLLFAQGFVVASERMWQMDLMRRLATGRLAEVFGEGALPADRFFRTLGLGEAARASFHVLEAPYRRYLEAYAAGVNAYCEHAQGRLPLEYLIAGFEPAPWRPEDSLAIGEYLAWTLSFDAREELVFLRFAARLGPEKARELFPADEGIPAPPDPPELPDFPAPALAGLDHLSTLPARWGLPSPGAASNAWALSGRRSAGGGALLANDPHLAPTMPGVWYEAELRAPGLHVAGVSLPGVPLIVIGHNRDLAWGFTTAMADTQDIFVERRSPDGAHVVRPDGKKEPIAMRTEMIAIRGRSEPERLMVRSTRHGVVINDVLGANTGTPMDLATVETDHLLALRSNLEVPDRAFAGVYGLNTAETVAAARAAVLEFKHATQTLMVAHRNGDIAWQMSGAIPLRGRGSGVYPAPGWESGYGWTGYAAPEHNPAVVAPSDGMLVAANNRLVAPDYPLNLGHTWMAPYRALRIAEMLEAAQRIDRDDMAEMQLDRRSVQVDRAQAALGRVATKLQALDPQAWRIAATYLLGWDGRLTGESREGAFFALLKAALFEALYGDELGEDLPALLAIAGVSYNALDEVLHSGRSTFWDDIRTPRVEGPADVWAKALRAAQAGLERLAGTTTAQRLDRVRRVEFPHGFDRVPLLGRLFSIGPIGIGGDANTVNVSKASPDAPGEVLFIPTLRVVYTPSDWSETRGTLTLGQSGHRFSPYRDDQLTDWLAGRNHAWPWEGPPPGSEMGVLILQPGP